MQLLNLIANRIEDDYSKWDSWIPPAGITLSAWLIDTAFPETQWTHSSLGTKYVVHWVVASCTNRTANCHCLRELNSRLLFHTKHLFAHRFGTDATSCTATYNRTLSSRCLNIYFLCILTIYIYHQLYHHNPSSDQMKQTHSYTDKVWISNNVPVYHINDRTQWEHHFLIKS